MKDAVHAEWTKLRTLASSFWLAAAAALLTVGASAAVTATTTYSPSNSLQDTTKLALTGIDLGQSLVAILAILAVSNEYSTGTIQTTLVAIPRRIRLLAAKATPITVTVLIVATVAVVGCLLAARIILPHSGYTPTHGYALLSLGRSTVRAAIGSVLYLILIALLSLGIATAIRGTAASVGTVLGLLYLPPMAAQLMGNTAWQRHLDQIAPTTAGLAIQATTNLRNLPIAPWAGLGVLAAWAGGTLLAGGLLLRLRDA
jgi:ABC-2 type transport system permease protein